MIRAGESIRMGVIAGLSGKITLDWFRFVTDTEEQAQQAYAVHQIKMIEAEREAAEAAQSRVITP